LCLVRTLQALASVWFRNRLRVFKFVYACVLVYWFIAGHYALTLKISAQDALLDEAVEETFPASDPIAPKQITGADD
jgi:hypothetical protein